MLIQLDKKDIKIPIKIGDTIWYLFNTHIENKWFRHYSAKVIDITGYRFNGKDDIFLWTDDILCVALEYAFLNKKDAQKAQYKLNRLIRKKRVKQIKEKKNENRNK